VNAAPLRIVIADDEPTARATLRLLLARRPDVAVLAECADGAATVAAVRACRPQLLFLDVQMPEMDGFEVLAELAPEEMPAVILVTAYDEHAIRAFEVHALDYLLKPFSDERFERALDRARREIAEHGLAELARRIRGLVDGAPARPAAAEGEPGPGRLLVPQTGRTQVVDVNEIDWIEAADYCVQLHAGKRSYLLRRPLSDLEAELDPARFVRIHRSTIVNVARVREIRPQFKGDAVVDLADGTELRVSRNRRGSLLAALARR
jgi:two-component system, LytTR family, response regulator